MSVLMGADVGADGDDAGAVVCPMVFRADSAHDAWRRPCISSLIYYTYMLRKVKHRCNHLIAPVPLYQMESRDVCLVHWCIPGDIK